MVTRVDTADQIDDGGARLRAALGVALKDAMRARDPLAASALRTALGAIGNAEAVVVTSSSRTSPATGSPHFAGAVAGLGAGEAARRRLSAAEVEAIVRAEIVERELAADEYAANGLSDQAGRLKREADVLRSVLSAPDPGHPDNGASE